MWPGTGQQAGCGQRARLRALARAGVLPQEGREPSQGVGWGGHAVRFPPRCHWQQEDTDTTLRTGIPLLTAGSPNQACVELSAGLR